jgi:hypothetical protein
MTETHVLTILEHTENAKNFGQSFNFTGPEWSSEHLLHDIGCNKDVQTAVRVERMDYEEFQKLQYPNQYVPARWMIMTG